MSEIDDADRILLRAIQDDGKISLQDLGELTGLSTSPAWRRVRRMEESGVISGYVGLMNAKALGWNALAFVHLSLRDHSPSSVKLFESFVSAEPQVTECYAITGTEEYLLKVIAPDPEALELFLTKRLRALPVVRSSTTHYALRKKKLTTALPI